MTALQPPFSKATIALASSLHGTSRSKLLRFAGVVMLLNGAMHLSLATTREGVGMQLGIAIPMLLVGVFFTFARFRPRSER